MAIETYYSPRRWIELFAGREAEFKQRLIRLSGEESQKIKITHPDPISRLTEHFYQRQPAHLGPSEALVLDDVLFDNRTGTLTLPFMPEYETLAGQVDEEISAPHNSGLSTWLAFGHLLHDQFSLEALYQLHPTTRDLPMAFNFYENAGLKRLVETQWKRSHRIIRKNITSFKRLHILMHRHHEFKSIQGEFLRKEFEVPDSNRLKDFFLPPSPARRIYIARSQRRRVINDEQLTLFLKERGFEKWQDSQLDTMTIREQAALFNSAEAIITPHGSHLSNCFFCRPNVVLIELFKFCWIEVSPFSILRAAAARGHYAYLVDWRPWETWQQQLIHADIRVPIPQLRTLLDRLKLR